MNFSQQEIIDIQSFRHPHFNHSATFNASLEMENDSKIVGIMNKKRGIDGVISDTAIKSVFDLSDIEISEWAQGEVDFKALAEYFNDDFDPPEIGDVVIDALKVMRISGNTAQLTSQLERNDYNKVNAILEALGGKWSKKASAHVFASKDPGEAIADFLETGKIEKPENFGFFETQTPLAKRLIKVADIQPADQVLEPSAGRGNLAKLAAEIVGIGNVRCLDIQKTNCDALLASGFSVEQTDFLTTAPSPIFDSVIMNPPFAKQADIDHVRHANSWLKPGGKLTAIMSLSITFRTNAKTTAFRDWLNSLGASIEENPADAFKASGTMARTVLISFKKPFDSAITKVENFQPETLVQLVTPVPTIAAVEEQACFMF